MTNSNSGGQTDVTFMAFSKAFDVVRHKLLFIKLTYLGISDCALDWAKYILANRRQRVVVDGEFSTHAPVALVSRKALCMAQYVFCVI